MKLSSLAALFGALLLCTVARAGTNSWTLIGPEGGLVTAVAVHPTDPMVVLASAGNGMYRSADGGLTWVRAGIGNDANDIVFDPANPNRVFVASGNLSLYRSDDAGQTFAAAPAPANTAVALIAVSGDSTLYIAGNQGLVFRSADLGATWVPSVIAWPSTAEVTAIAVERANSHVVYAALKGIGIFKSTDSGASWGAPLTNSPGTASTQTRVFQIVIKPDDPNRILAAASDGAYVSANGGTAWSNPLAAFNWQSIAFDPAANNNVVAVSYQGQIHRSSDGGLTWPAGQQGPNLRVSQVPRVLFAPANKVIVATSDGPMVSTNGGTNFSLRVNGMHTEGIRAFSSADNGVTFAAFSPGPFGIYQRELGWAPLDNAELKSRLTNPFISSLAVAPGNAQRLYVASGSELVSSADGGQSWSLPHPQFTPGSTVVMRTVVDPTDAQVVYVLTQNSGVWKSENGGSTYIQRTTGLPAALNALTVDRANPLVLYAGGYFTGATGVFRSTNGGVSWVPTGALPDLVVVDIVLDPTNSSVVYALLSLGIYKSTNGGDTWAPLDMGGPVTQITSRGLAFDPNVPTTLYVANHPDGIGFARSVDAGVTWQTVPWTVLPSRGSLDVFTLDRAFRSNVIAGGYGTGLYQYQVSNDLRVSTTSPLNLALNATGSLTFLIENLGPFHAAAPEFQVNVPANLNITVPAGCTSAASTLRCELPAINAGQSRNFVLQYTAAATETAAAMGAHIFGREYDLLDTNNSLGIDVRVATVANLGVTATAIASAQRDTAVTFSSTGTNTGPNSSSLTTLVVQAPAGITVQTSTPTAGTCATAGAVITCELGALASGATATVALTGTATTVGSQAWSSTVSTTAGHDQVAGNNTATATTTVTAPPAPPSSSSSGGGGGGGGRFDWLAVLLLGGLAVSRGFARVSARR